MGWFLVGGEQVWERQGDNEKEMRGTTKDRKISAGEIKE